jgi:hypothetical protein
LSESTKTIDLSPRTVVHWQGGKRTDHEGIVPTPFDQKRAQEIWAQRGLCYSLDGVITEGESAYVSALWDTMPGYTCWMSAFFEILNGRV